MSRKILYCLVLGSLLVSLAFAPAVAQIVNTVPDAGVRGSGVIDLPRYGTVGLFDINIARYGAILTGGFRFSEVDSTGVRVNTVITKEILSLTVVGNHATIEARGYWRNMWSRIVIEALDDNFSGDNLRVFAAPIDSPILIIYERQGGVIKGDLTVYSKPQIVSFAKGYGTIPVKWNVGTFEFSAQSIWDGTSTSPVKTEGKIYYAEFNPRIDAISPRPAVQILVPNVVSLVVRGNQATLRGPGTINGRPANVTVIAVDNSRPEQMSPVFIPDEFTIWAADKESNRMYYYASGKLSKGDIVVGSYSGQ